MEVWKIIFLSKFLISRFHVNLPGCKLQGAEGSGVRMKGKTGSLTILTHGFLSGGFSPNF